jgi:hypothetical protein
MMNGSLVVVADEAENCFENETTLPCIEAATNSSGKSPDKPSHRDLIIVYCYPDMLSGAHDSPRNWD